MAVATGSNSHRYNHHHKLQPQSPDPPTNSKSKNLNKKKKNSKSSTKPQPNRSINDQTQPTIGGEIYGESYGGRQAKNGDYGARRAKIGDCPWVSRASDRQAELQIDELQSASFAANQNRLLRDRKRKRER